MSRTLGACEQVSLALERRINCPDIIRSCALMARQVYPATPATRAARNINVPADPRPGLTSGRDGAEAFRDAHHPQGRGGHAGLRASPNARPQGRPRHRPRRSGERRLIVNATMRAPGQKTRLSTAIGPMARPFHHVIATGRNRPTIATARNVQNARSDRSMGSPCGCLTAAPSPPRVAEDRPCADPARAATDFNAPPGSQARPASPPRCLGPATSQASALRAARG